MSKEEIGLVAQNFLVILASIFNKKETKTRGGGVCGHLMTRSIVTLTMDRMFIQAPKFMRRVVTSTIWFC